MLFNYPLGRKVNMKLLKGDTVKVLKGKDKGKTGKVEAVFPKESSVRIEGINEFKRHFKSRAQNQKSEIITITKPLAVANVAFVCPKCKKATKIGFRMEKDKKVRFCRKCEKVVD